MLKEKYHFLKNKQGIFLVGAVLVYMSAKITSHLTYNIKLQTESAKEHDLLLKTLLIHQKIWDHISKDTFKHKNIDKK